MSAAWWGKEALDPKVPPLADGSFGSGPRVVDAEGRSVERVLRARRSGFTEDWREPPEGDAGTALFRVFAEQASLALARANLLPEKARVLALLAAGVAPTPARPAEAMVVFSVAPGRGESTLVPAGFKAAARPATGSGDLVTFETQASLRATSAKIAEIYAVRGSAHRDVLAESEDAESSFHPFGEDPQTGNSLLIGLDGDEAPYPTLTIGFQLAEDEGRPLPVSAGGVPPAPLPGVPLLRWEALTGAAFETLQVAGDDTNHLTRSGVVDLRIPRKWQQGRPAGTPEGEPRRWLRVRLLGGSVDPAPRINIVRLNMARVRAVRSYRNEVLVPVDDAASREAPVRRLKVRHVPVVPGSMIVEIDETLPRAGGEDTEVTRWSEVEDLSTAGSTDRVFTLDPSSGAVTFGDGRRGAAISSGFRNVRAVRYEVGGGAGGAAGAGEIKILLDSAPFVTGVENPIAASGGADTASQKDTVLDGPALLRARGRAVTVADYAVMALAAPGADVRRAHAISGYHPRFVGTSLAGVVGVLVVASEADSGPPLPDEGTLRALATWLTDEVAPAGVEVVAAAPVYRMIRTEVRFVADPGADVGAVIRALVSALDAYLDPLVGGARSRGWGFGSTLSFATLTHRLMEQVPEVTAIPELRLIVDGVPMKACADVPLQPDQLFWTDAHDVASAEDAS